MRIVFVLLLVYGFVHANTLIHFQKGWSLVGVPSVLENMSDFNNSNVKIVWGYDAKEQKWRGYSPVQNIRERMAHNEISPLRSLSPWQAIWIYNENGWSLELKSSDFKSNENSFIELVKGWNLVSIPQDVVVSKDFFGDGIIWKYTQDENWSSNYSGDGVDFPNISDIKQSEGLWVLSDKNITLDIAQELSKLRTFDTQAQMLDYLRAMIQAKQHRYYSHIYFDTPGDLNDTGVLDSVDAESLPASNNKPATDATETNLQESGVDESDILKHDGKYIFSLDKTNSSIFITSFERLAQKNYSALTTLALQGKSIQSMYLQKNRLILLSNDFASIPYTDEGMQIGALPYKRAWKNGIYIYNVEDITNIKRINAYEIDGIYQDSRLVDGTLFLISNFTPEIEYQYPKVYEQTPCTTLNKNSIYDYVYDATSYQAWHDNNCYNYHYDDNGAWRYDYKNPSVLSESLSPNITHNGTSHSLLNPSKLYAPYKLNQSTSITSITSFDIVDALYNENIAFVGYTSSYYVSQNAMYLTSKEYPLYYDFRNYKEREVIYKFSLDGALAYKGKGSVNGSILNQFSMSEYNSYLRVATSSGVSWRNDTNNSLFILKEKDENLEIISSVTGLGKEGELIKSVRFMGKRGYVVTFRETDPLYTLDLSDPYTPHKVGELSIPGFSTYLHVIDENRVLSIGRDADNSGRVLGLQLQLFDVTDFANPCLADKIKVGTDLTYSPAEYNHKALAYRTSDLLFGFPYTDYSYTKDTQEYYQPTSATENFGVYKIEEMKIKEIQTLSKTLHDNYWGNEKRGLLFDINNTSYGVLFEGSEVLSNSILQGE